MISTPFNLFDCFNFDFSKKQHQNFALKLHENIGESFIKNKSNENLDYKSLKPINGEEIRTTVLNWFSKISQEDKIKISTIQSNWLIKALYQMYLLFIKNNKVSFEPKEEILIFFKNYKEEKKGCSNSLISFNLLNFKKISSNDETKFDKKKVEKEINSIEEDSMDNDSPSTYFKCRKSVNHKIFQDKNYLEKEFLNHIKIISLNEEELDTITLDLELLSDVELLKKYFQFFTNDNYFKDWIYTFENKDGIKNFYLPNWMSKYNLSFCQVIIGFLEQHILLNYEYFYFNNNIYEMPNNDKIILFHKEIDDMQDQLINKFNNNNKEKEKNDIIINKNIYNNKKEEKNDIILNENIINNIDLLNNDKQNKEENNEKLQRIISKTSMSTLDDSFSISQYQEEEDSISITSDTTNSSKNRINKISNNISYNNNFFYNDYYYYNNFYYYNFINMIFTYYDQQIMNYSTIINNNLSIYNKIKEKYRNEIQNFIKDNFKDKYDISFGHYGSYFTGLQIEGSDMDIFILYKSKENNNNINILTFGNELYSLIRNRNPLYGPFKLPDDVNPPLVILNIDIYDEIIKSPINNFFGYINFKEIEKLKVDLTFNNNEEYFHINEKNVNYVKNAITKYPQIKPVIFVLKRYFKNINMSKVFEGGISSFSIFLLTLNAIKSYLKDNPNNQIGISQLLFYILKKFSSFDFCHFGIGSDNYDYKLNEKNTDESLYILDPITGKNIAYGKCKGDKLRKAFCNAYNILNNEINQLFNLGYLPYNSNPIFSLNNLFHSRINYYG